LTADYLLPALAVLFVMAVIIVTGRRRGEPAWVIAGQAAGFAILSAGLFWAATISADADALLAAIVAGFGVAVMAQAEFMWWRRRDK
jgi:hypothetical protein